MSVNFVVVVLWVVAESHTFPLFVRQVIHLYSYKYITSLSSLLIRLLSERQVEVLPILAGGESWGAKSLGKEKALPFLLILGLSFVGT